jgi:hypothetical protein
MNSLERGYSMSSEEEIIETVVIEEPVVVEPESEPEPVLEEKTHSYQPTDENGKPLGGRQVLKYRTPEELTAKLEEQTILLIRRLRAETRKNRLGLTDDEEIPAEAPRVSTPVEFSQTMTPDERYQLARDLNIDPERLDETTKAIFESTFGASPEVLKETIRQLQEDSANTKARIEGEAFVRDNADYFPCVRNLQAITLWMTKRNLAPVRENFKFAYDTLKAANVLDEWPATEATAAPPEPAPVVPVVEPKVEPPPVQPGRIPSGLNKTTATDIGPTRAGADEITFELQVGSEKRVYKGLAAIEAMPADEYKRRTLKDPSFAKREEKLRLEAAERRRNRS